MYVVIGIIIVLFAVCYCVAVQRNITVKQLFRVTGYEAYYYLLGGKGILEDYVHFGQNKTRMYIKNYLLLDICIRYKYCICAMTCSTSLA
jgi:hypothetical protein